MKTQPDKLYPEKSNPFMADHESSPTRVLLLLNWEKNRHGGRDGRMRCDIRTRLTQRQS